MDVRIYALYVLKVSYYLKRKKLYINWLHPYCVRFEHFKMIPTLLNYLICLSQCWLLSFEYL